MTDDLITNATEPDSPGSDPLTIAIQETAHKVAELRHELEDCKGLQKFLEELISYRDKGWILHLKALCDREIDRLRRLREANHSIVATLEELYRDAREQSRRMPTLIPSQMERLASAFGIEIDLRKSRHPRYYFGRDGFLEASIDDQRLTATVSTREGRLATMPADPDAVLKTVREESKRLFDRKFAGTRFLGDTHKAYLAAIKARKGAREGDPIPLREIYTQMAKKAKGYKRDEFLVDLSRLLEQGPAETSGCRFDLQQTKDTQEGVLLLGAAGRGMVNLMVFKKPNSSPS